MLTFSEPKIITCGPYNVVGCYGVYAGDDDEPGWAGADAAFNSRRHEVTNPAGDLTLGFMYRPHQDDFAIPLEIKACFVGIEVADLDHFPDGMVVTHFSGGEYVIIESRGDTAGEAAEGVEEAIGFLSSRWMPEHGYTAGDACFAAGTPGVTTVKPPYIEYVYFKIEKKK